MVMRFLALSLLLASWSMAQAEHAPPAATSAPASDRESRQALAKPAARSLGISAAFDGRGRLWLARVEQRHVWVSLSADGGISFNPATRVNTEPEAIAADGENRPKIAIAADGTVHVSWTVSLDRPYTGHVRYSRSTDGGKTYSAPITVDDDAAEASPQTSHRFESLLVRGDRVVLAWLDGRERKAAEAAGRKVAGAALYYAVSDDAGAHFSPNRRAVENTCECCRVALAWQGEQATVLWRHVYPGNIRDFALARLGDPTPPRRVSDDQWELAGCPHHGGALATDAQDRVHLTWYTQGKARQGLFYRRLDQDGLSEPVKFGNDQAQAGHPAVIASGATVLLAWREFDGHAYSVWIKHSNDGGFTWSPPCPLLTSETPSDYPQLITGREQPWLLWNSEREGVRILPLGAVKS